MKLLTLASSRREREEGMEGGLSRDVSQGSGPANVSRLATKADVAATFKLIAPCPCFTESWGFSL